MKTQVAFIHTSPAAIPPLMQFYGEAAPELQITNLLDDGLLRLLAAKQHSIAQLRLAEMIRSAIDTYKCELAMITCSSVTRQMADELKTSFEVPILKIDYPMAREAVETGTRIGLAATFPPTIDPTSRLLEDAAREIAKDIEIVQAVVPEAYEALLSADTAKHDALLLDALNELNQQKVSVIVLAQVSMARILPLVKGRFNIPVLSSLQTSLKAIRNEFDATNVGL
jgi:glutamate racemase